MTDTKTAGSSGSPEPPNAPIPLKKPGRKRRLIVLAFAAVVILGGGGAAAFWAAQRTTAAPTARKPGGKPAAKPVERGLVALDPFVVNLADQGGSRFLRVSVRLIVGSLEEAEHLKEGEVALTRARSAILELLTEQTADRLVTAEGKAALKAAIALKLEPVLEGTKVLDVLFSDFVVQF